MYTLSHFVMIYDFIIFYDYSGQSLKVNFPIKHCFLKHFKVRFTPQLKCLNLKNSSNRLTEAVPTERNTDSQDDIIAL